MAVPIAPGPPISAFVVVVPAHNEVEMLPAAIESIEVAAREVLAPVRIVVVLDACSDGTSTVIPDGIEVRVISERNVGAARQDGFVEETVARDIWFATTDADSQVPRNWLSLQADLAVSGADAVAGTISVDDWSAWPPDAASDFAALYTDRDGHRHVHGANLGVRSSVYRDVGGFAGLVEHEDVDLVERIVASGAHIVWSAQAPVATSTRRSGRTPGGFSAELARMVDGRPLGSPVRRATSPTVTR